jgi:anti-sigma factor RsiW
MTVESTAAMECADLERSLDVFLDGELDERDHADAAAHLAGCDPCRALVERRGHVRDGLRRCLRTAMGGDTEAGHAPATLRLRIVSALEHERRPWWRRVLSPVPLAALAACAAGALLVLVTHTPAADPLVEEAVRRHVRDLPLEVTAAAVGPESVPAWFAGKLDFNPRPPRFATPEVRLVGARLSHISDRPAAYMRYEGPRGHLGLFIVEDPHHRFGDGGRAVRIGPEGVRVVNARGYRIAVWRHDEIVYSLVGDLDEHQLARVLASAAAQADR